MSANRTFGVEEEYLLLDVDTGMPTDAANQLIDALPGYRAEHEFLLSQLETATEPCETANQALAELGDFRRAAAHAATERGLMLAGSGLPPVGGETVSGVSEVSRYQHIRSQVRGAVKRYFSTGTHVHVAVPSRDAGLAAIATFARWSPLFMALTANSPIFLGEDTGFACWRNQFIQQWATSGYPPHFADAEEHDRLIANLVRVEAIVDSALVNWTIRLSEKFPTIELRITDAQLTVADSVASAVLFRALVSRGLREYELSGMAPAPQPDSIRSAHWLAARDGLTGRLFDPYVMEPRPVFELIDEMLDYAADELGATGDTELIADYIYRRRGDLGPAQLQRAAWEEGGLSALLSLYRTNFA